MTLKSNNSALRGGDAAVTTYLLKTSADDKILAYVRKNGKDEVLTVLNFSKEDVSFTINDDHISGSFKDIFEKKSRNFSENKDFSMKVGDFLVFEK